MSGDDPDAFGKAFGKAFDAVRRYKAEMARRPAGPLGSLTGARGGLPLLLGSMGDSDAGAELREKAFERVIQKNIHAFDLASHHIVLAYLRRLASGGAEDRNFEARSLQADLRITPVQVAAVLYGYARDREIPTDRGFRHLLAPNPCDEDALASHFMKIMAFAEIAKYREADYLSLLFQGLLSESDDGHLLFLSLVPQADNVRFVVELCRSMDALRLIGANVSTDRSNKEGNNIGWPYLIRKSPPKRQATGTSRGSREQLMAKVEELYAQLPNNYWPEFDLIPFAHRPVFDYLKLRWAGVEPDSAFERKSLKHDFGMKGFNLAALFFLVAIERKIPLERVYNFLSPSVPGADDSVSTMFRKVMTMAEEMDEDRYLCGLAAGAVVDPRQSQYNRVPILDYADSVEFLVRHCVTLEILKKQELHDAVDVKFGEIDDDPGWHR